jgi:uncharacterized protein YjbJ (UPF0337 family)
LPSWDGIIPHAAHRGSVQPSSAVRTVLRAVRVCADRPAAPPAYLFGLKSRFGAQGAAMNEDRMEGNWKQFKGKVKEQWGKLTDDDLDVIAGKRDQLAGKIQERHGIARDEAERQIKDFESRNPDTRFR